MQLDSNKTAGLCCHIVPDSVTLLGPKALKDKDTTNPLLASHLNKLLAPYFVNVTCHCMGGCSTSDIYYKVQELIEDKAGGDPTQFTDYLCCLCTLIETVDYKE